MKGYKFSRQKPIGNYIVDFFCNRLRLAIEIDGSTHFDQMEKDEKRQKELEKLDIRFLRFGDTQVKQNMESVILEIKEWINENE